MDDRYRPIHRRLTAVVVLLVALATLAACSMSRDDSSTTEADPGDGGATRAAQPSKEPAEPTASTNAQQTDAQQEKQLLTYDASLTVRVKDTDKALSKAERLVGEAGGHIERQQLAGTGSTTMTTTFRVPSEDYRKVLRQLSGLGERLSLSQRTENVTQEVADVDARVKSANASLDRLRTLLKRASDVDDVLAVERQISTRQAELEALQARQRSLAKQVSYATITLDIDGPVAEEERQTGFLAGLKAGWRGFVAFVEFGLTAVGAVLPFLIVLGPVGVGGYLLWRRSRRIRARRKAEAASLPPLPSNPSHGGGPAEGVAPPQ